jgi:hypothetical protein
MRLLHVGSGFRPWRRGGLVAYVEDLVDEQARRGHDVAYVFAGRRYPYVRGPRLRRWRRGDVAMLEIVNSPLYDHGRQPLLELDEPSVERLFERVVREQRPDVVHVHEIAGLPSSVLEVARRLGVPTVVTLQDYFFLCPTFKLLDAAGRVCPRGEVGAECVTATAADPRPAWLMVEATLRHDLPRLPVVRRLPARPRDRAVARLSTALARRTAGEATGDAAAFARRRAVNVERLGAATRVIAMSERVAALHVERGVDARRVRTLQLTLAHIDGLHPRRPRPGAPVVFATLGALESEAKGGRLLLDAVRSLSAEAPPGSFRVAVLGHVDGAFAAEAHALDAVELRGPVPARAPRRPARRRRRRPHAVGVGGGLRLRGRRVPRQGHPGHRQRHRRHARLHPAGRDRLAQRVVHGRRARADHGRRGRAPRTDRRAQRAPARGAVVDRPVHARPRRGDGRGVR